MELLKGVGLVTAVVALPDYGGLVFSGRREMPVEAVVRGVEFSVQIPFYKGFIKVPFQDLVPFFRPNKGLFGHSGPEFSGSFMDSL